MTAITIAPTKKATVATLKAFIRKNRKNLFVEVQSTFDGMTDCVERDYNSNFVRATDSDIYNKNTLGINGVWVVGGDLIRSYNKNGFIGYNVYNCCGSFNLAVPA